MLELTGLGSLFKGVGLLYWPLAIGCIFLALKLAKGARLKVLCVASVALAFGYLPVTSWIEQSRREAFAREAWAYFKKKCETEAGEKIYKTFTGVKSVLVVKPLPPATEKDLFDQYWMGDPYTNATPWPKRGESEAGKLVFENAPVREGVLGNGYEYVDVVSSGEREKTITTRFRYSSISRNNVSEIVGKSDHRFGIEWNDISTRDDRARWVAASRLRVIDLVDQSVVGERIGFFIESGFGSRAGQRLPWLTSKGPSTTCPYSHDWSSRWFIFRVLNPNSEPVDAKR